MIQEYQRGTYSPLRDENEILMYYGQHQFGITDTLKPSIKILRNIALKTIVERHWTFFCTKLIVVFRITFFHIPLTSSAEKPKPRKPKTTVKYVGGT